MPKFRDDDTGSLSAGLRVRPPRHYLDSPRTMHKLALAVVAGRRLVPQLCPPDNEGNHEVEGHCVTEV